MLLLPEITCSDFVIVILKDLWMFGGRSEANLSPPPSPPPAHNMFERIVLVNCVLPLLI